jgi:hypothetical protein
MSKVTGEGRRHRREVPQPRPLLPDPDVHAAHRRIEQAARLAEEMQPTGGKHRREAS